MGPPGTSLKLAATRAQRHDVPARRMAPRHDFRPPGQESTGPSLSVPRALILGVLMLVAGNYYYSSRSSQPHRTQASAPGSAPDDATTRNLALAKLQSRLRERDSTIRQLEAQIQEAQHAQHAALSAQPPSKPADAPKAVAPVGTPSEAAPASSAASAVVLRDEAAVGGGELVDVPTDLVFPDALRKSLKGSDLFIGFSSGKHGRLRAQLGRQPAQDGHHTGARRRARREDARDRLGGGHPLDGARRLEHQDAGATIFDQVLLPTAQPGPQLQPQPSPAPAPAPAPAQPQPQPRAPSPSPSPSPGWPQPQPSPAPAPAPPSPSPSPAPAPAPAQPQPQPSPSPAPAPSPSPSLTPLRIGCSAYKRMAALKVAFYTRILTMGFNIWACDADTGWMGDPAPFIQEP